MEDLTNIREKVRKYHEIIRREKVLYLAEEGSKKINNKKICHPENSDICGGFGQKNCQRDCHYSKEIETLLKKELKWSKIDSRDFYSLFNKKMEN